MSPIQIRRALAGLTVLGALAALGPVHAASTSLTIQINDPDGACESWTPGGSAGAPTLTCVKAGGTPSQGSVPVCTVTADGANPLNLSAGKTVLLNASCSNTDANTNYAWSGAGTLSGTNVSGQNVAVSATTTFSVVATNGTGPSASKSVAVNITPAAPPPSPPPSGALACSGFNNTVTVDLTWPGSKAQAKRSTSSPFGNGDIVVARFTTPANLANNGSGGFLNVVEYGGPPADRLAVLSKEPCDFSWAADATHALYKNAGAGSSPNVYFNANIYSGVALQPGTTYYLNIKNATLGGVPSCSSSDCPVLVTLSTN